MKLNDYMKLFLKNFFNNKINIVLVIFLTLLSSVMFFCFSYYDGVKQVWNKWFKNSYDFDLAYITYDNDVVSQKELINKLRENSHILDVFLYDGLLGYGVIDEFSASDMNGHVSLMGTISGNKSILYGDDLNDNDIMEMICPSNFFPDTIYVNDSYNVNKIIDLKDRIGEDINMKYLNKYDVSMKLVGVFDSSYDYSEPNICYVSHSTLKRLNNLYQSELSVDSMPIYIQLDDISNINNIKKYIGSSAVVQMKKIKTDVIDRVINLTSGFVVIAIIGIFFLSYLFYLRKINSQYKQIGIMKIVGYKNNIIKSLFYLEVVLVAVVSNFLGYVVANVALNKYVDLFLYSDPQLSIMDVSISWISVIVIFMLMCCVLFISVTIALRKINNFDIRDVVYE